MKASNKSSAARVREALTAGTNTKEQKGPPVIDGHLSPTLDTADMLDWRCRATLDASETSSSYLDDDDAGPKPYELYGKFTWKIENFSEVTKRELRSDVFDVGNFKWYILVYPNGCDVCNHLSLFLCVANYDKLLPGWNHFAQFTIAVVNKDPKKSKYSDTLHRFCKKEHDWGWKKFMELSKVFDGFTVADTLVIKAQVQVIIDKPAKPFRCLDPQYRRELVRVYLSNVESICRKFCEEKRGKLAWVREKSIEFRKFWSSLSSERQRDLCTDAAAPILKGLVKQFTNEKEVTSTLVMDALYSGSKQIEQHSRDFAQDPIMQPPILIIDQDRGTMTINSDIINVYEKVAIKEYIPASEDASRMLPPSEGLVLRTGQDGDDYRRDSIEKDEKRLAELGRKAVEFFAITHIFSEKIQIAYREAEALQRQDVLIAEELAAERTREVEAQARALAEAEKKAKNREKAAAKREAERIRREAEEAERAAREEEQRKMDVERREAERVQAEQRRLEELALHEEFLRKKAEQQAAAAEAVAHSSLSFDNTLPAPTPCSVEGSNGSIHHPSNCSNENGNGITQYPSNCTCQPAGANCQPPILHNMQRAGSSERLPATSNKQSAATHAPPVSISSRSSQVQQHHLPGSASSVKNSQHANHPATTVTVTTSLSAPTTVTVTVPIASMLHVSSAAAASSTSSSYSSVTNSADTSIPTATSSTSNFVLSTHRSTPSHQSLSNATAYTATQQLTAPTSVLPTTAADSTFHPSSRCSRQAAEPGYSSDGGSSGLGPSTTKPNSGNTDNDSSSITDSEDIRDALQDEVHRLRSYVMQLEKQLRERDAETVWLRAQLAQLQSMVATSHWPVAETGPSPANESSLGNALLAPPLFASLLSNGAYSNHISSQQDAQHLLPASQPLSPIFNLPASLSPTPPHNKQRSDSLQGTGLERSYSEPYSNVPTPSLPLSTLPSDPFGSTSTAPAKTQARSYAELVALGITSSGTTSPQTPSALPSLLPPASIPLPLSTPPANHANGIYPSSSASHSKPERTLMADSIQPDTSATQVGTTAAFILSSSSLAKAAHAAPFIPASVAAAQAAAASATSQRTATPTAASQSGSLSSHTTTTQNTEQPPQPAQSTQAVPSYRNALAGSLPRRKSPTPPSAATKSSASATASQQQAPVTQAHQEPSPDAVATKTAAAQGRGSVSSASAPSSAVDAHSSADAGSSRPMPTTTTTSQAQAHSPSARFPATVPRKSEPAAGASTPGDTYSDPAASASDASALHSSAASSSASTSAATGQGVLAVQQPGLQSPGGRSSSNGSWGKRVAQLQQQQQQQQPTVHMDSGPGLDDFAHMGLIDDLLTE